ncbi:MAG: nucleotidyltransferase family protein [Candidatus Heimdallarchaeaceae archaeon]
MKAVILAGGLGTRLYPITYEMPKPLLRIKKKPIINYLVDLFLKTGVKEIGVLISENFEEDFIWWKKRYYPKKKIRFFKEKKPLGTLGGLYYLKKWISKDNFFLTNGDELKKIDLKKMKDFHQKKGVLATIALVKVKNPQDYGVVLCKNGIVQKFLEKPKNPPSKYINSGLYIFSPGVFKYHPGPKFLMIETNLFPKLARKGELAGFKFNGKWADCGTWDRYSSVIKNWK